MIRANLFALFVVAGAHAGAQQPNPIPIRKVTTLASTDSGVIANVYVMQPRSDGRVLLNDATRRRLLLFDSTLKTFKVIADTARESKNSFGNNNSGGLLFYAGSDSAAFVDRSSSALIVVDRDGHFGTVTTPPKANDMVYFAGSAFGVPGFDAKGRLFYRGAMPVQDIYRPPSGDSLITSPDTAPILRADFDTRRVDTIAMMRIPFVKQRLHVMPPNGMQFITILNPLPFTDEWAYLRDGTVAVVRGQDYHVDWYLPDGSKKSTPKMPFDWRRLTDEDKQKMLDSVQRVSDSSYDAMVARMAASGAPTNRFPKNDVVKANELPDYYPPVRNAGQMRVDLDGNLWIMPTTSVAAVGGTLYDVVNRKGEIIERVQLPQGRNLHGFGPGGIIYLSVPVGFGWPRIERARVERPNAQ